MSNIECELATAAKNWSKVWGEFEGKIGTLHARLISGWEMSEDGDGGPPPTVEDHFLALLATGAAGFGVSLSARFAFSFVTVFARFIGRRLRIAVVI